MTVAALSAISDVQARISAIESRFGASRPLAAATAASASGSVGAAGTVDFASLLETYGAGAAGSATEPGGAPAAAGAANAGTGTGATAEPYASLFQAAGARHGVSPDLLAAVAKAESSFNPTAVSPAGAQGLMQLMPSTAQGLGVDPLVPDQAVDGAARLLRSHLDRFGSVDLALAAYNAGPGAVQRHGGVPPYRETQDYISRVKATMEGAA